MLTFKIVAYSLTSSCAFLLAFWEMRLRRQLTDRALVQQHENASDYSDLSYGIQKEIRRERILKYLPGEALFKLKLVAGLKFLLVAILIAEVVVFQR
jgi:hypothetical protein